MQTRSTKAKGKYGMKGAITNDVVIFSLVAFGLLGVALHGLRASIRDAAAKEISSAAYDELKTIAAKSCSGTEILRTVVKAGPVLGKDMPTLRLDLERRAMEQAQMTSRAEIANLPVGCA